MTVETVELRDSARRVLAGLGIAADEKKTWAQIVELGWLLISIPEELGGLGQGLDAACTLYTELGASLTTTPYLPAMLALDAICHGKEDARAALLDRFTSGELATAALARSSLTVTDKGDGG